MGVGGVAGSDEVQPSFTASRSQVFGTHQLDVISMTISTLCCLKEDGEPGDNPEGNVPKDTILLADAETPMGEQIALQLILARQKVRRSHELHLPARCLTSSTLVHDYCLRAATHRWPPPLPCQQTSPILLPVLESCGRQRSPASLLETLMGGNHRSSCWWQTLQLPNKLLAATWMLCRGRWAL